MNVEKDHISNTYYLYPAGIFASKEPAVVSTVLGSCVSVCLYDPILQIGGINHFMLPLWNGQGLASPKYGNIAIVKLIEKMQEMGSLKRNLIAKVFGGAEIIQTKIKQFNIGERNIALAKEVLAQENIAILKMSVGDVLGRKIIFNTNTGSVMQKYIQKTEFNLILPTEKVVQNALNVKEK
ncbi:MAG: chemotaxis protein CheD [Bacteroidetes bacterium HGW-Bacteroidetes-21]|jgi:chemotaxis protein CheD|nr:MAG: chemotaxis protein CheD [Bacteroidetes bacterium HGW-Bacteroidetes-21]